MIVVGIDNPFVSSGTWNELVVNEISIDQHPNTSEMSRKSVPWGIAEGRRGGSTPTPLFRLESDGDTGGRYRPITVMEIVMCNSATQDIKFHRISTGYRKKDMEHRKRLKRDQE